MGRKVRREGEQDCLTGQNIASPAMRTPTGSTSSRRITIIGRTRPCWLSPNKAKLLVALTASLPRSNTNWVTISGVPDVPEGVESHAPVMISGVLVPEIVEEINDAYDDLLLDIGKYSWDWQPMGSRSCLLCELFSFPPMTSEVLTFLVSNQCLLTQA